METLQQKIEKRIRSQYVHYDREVYIKHVEELVKDLLRIAGIEVGFEPTEKQQAVLDRMVEHVIDRFPYLVDLRNGHSWVNNNYESRGMIPPFV